MGMDTVVGVAGLAFAGLLGCPTILLSLLLFRNSIAVSGADWQDIIDLTDGYAKVQAQAATTDGTVTAPFSGRECLAVETAIERYYRKGEHGGRSWNDDHTVRESVPFDIEDPTGSVRVEPTGADWFLGNDYEHVVESGEVPTGPHADFVTDNEVWLMDDEGISEAHKIRFVERRIEPGDEIAVFGPYDGSGAERRIRADDGRFVDKLFSIADGREDITQSVGSGVMTLLFGLVFTAGGLGFAWLAFS